MKIVILGAGMVGATLAEQLVAEGHDIALVDLDEDLLSDISQRLDLKAVCGQASYPDVMREAGSEEADMVVAVTDNDEVNMVACQVAYSLFQVPLKIARIRTPHYFIRKELYSNDNLPIDVFINPEVMLTRHIRHLVDVPGCRQVLDFFGSRIRIVEVSINSDSAWCGRASVECLADHDNVRLAAVARDGVMLVATEGLTLQAGDQIFLAASSRAVIPMMASISGTLQPCLSVMVAGGGHIGLRLARKLSEKYTVKLIDHNQTRCEYLTAQLDNVLVLCGEAADKGLLVGENIHNVDVFCAVTNDDEANIMACMQAKRLGARRVVALVNRVAYLDLLADLYIDVVLNPQGVTVSGILTHLRTGDFTKACVVHRGAAEIVEVVIRGDEETSNLVGQQVDELDLPSGVKLVSMMRSEKILWPGDVATIKSEDRMLLFVTHKDQMHQLEKMFQVRPLYV